MTIYHWVNTQLLVDNFVVKVECVRWLNSGMVNFNQFHILAENSPEQDIPCKIVVFCGGFAKLPRCKRQWLHGSQPTVANHSVASEVIEKMIQMMHLSSHNWFRRKSGGKPFSFASKYGRSPGNSLCNRFWISPNPSSQHDQISSKPNKIK